MVSRSDSARGREDYRFELPKPCGRLGLLKVASLRGIYNVVLKDKTCLIVGASGAIGSAIVRRFQQEGARLALTSRSGAAKNSPAGVIENKTSLYALDVCDWDEVRRLVESVVARWGGLDVLVNCAGVIGPIGPLADSDVDHWKSSVEINLIGAYHLARAVVPVMLRSGGGKIINFSGGGAAYGRPYFTAYAAAKAAIVRLTESLAQELRERDIDVNAIAPGPVRSRMWDELRKAGEAAGQKAAEELRQMDDTGGISPERAADLAVFLASERSSGLTGKLISAVHDRWCDIPEHIAEFPADAWTLRRVPLK